MTFRGQLDAVKRRLDAAEASIPDSFQVIVAEDFLVGGCPTTAEAYDRSGAMLATFTRGDDETFAAFVARLKETARGIKGATRLKIGGLALWAPRDAARPGEPVPRGAVTLPETPPHPSQLEALVLIRDNRHVSLTAGRRWGKPL